MYTLEFEHVTKRYGHEVVVDDLTFTAKPGRVTGFLGPNGAGKSTAMKILLDLAKAEHGRATIGGQRYRDMQDPARAGRRGARAQRLSPRTKRTQPSEDPRRRRRHYPGPSDRDAGSSRAEPRCGPPRGRLLPGDATTARPGGCAARRPPGAGPRRARQWTGPAGDPRLRDLLRKRAAAGGTVFVSSHLLAEVEHMADEVVVLEPRPARRPRVCSRRCRRRVQLRPYLRPRSAHRDPDLGRVPTVRTGAEGELIVRRPMGTAEIGDRAYGSWNRTPRTHPPSRIARGAVPGLDKQRPKPDQQRAPKPTVGNRDREAGSTSMTMLRLLRGRRASSPPPSCHGGSWQCWSSLPASTRRSSRSALTWTAARPSSPPRQINSP